MNAQSLGRLQKETQMGMYDLMFHVGDFAYDMDTVRNAKKINQKKMFSHNFGIFGEF